MSLINVRNLSAPIRSKVQIGGLIIVALLVLVIRYGSHSGDAPRGGSRAPIDDSEDAQRQKELLDLLDDSSPARRPGGADTDDAMVDDLVSGRFAAEQAKKRQEAPKNDSFNDIRKSLGLE
jgi:hypothetical protein